ncbi:hypothetical protein D3C72_2050540 [compost metagenome]
MLDLLLQNAEYPGGGFPAGLAAAHGTDADGDAIAIDVGTLLGEADHYGHGPHRRDLRVPEKLARLEAFELAPEFSRGGHLQRSRFDQSSGK